MPSLARARLAPRTTITALALALCATLLLAAAAPASAVTRKQAAKKALAALGSRSGSDAVIVFGLPKPVRSGMRVTQTGAAKPVATVGAERAFFFYEDSGPFRPYPHAGRVALVGARSGKVRLSKSIATAPRLNGKLPAFLRSDRAYRSSKYRVFYRPWGDVGSPPQAFAVPGEVNLPPNVDGQSVTAKRNSPKRITLKGSDPDGDLLTFYITKPPDHGTLSGQPPNVVYTPAPNYLGADDFLFKANDGELDSNAARVSITVTPKGAARTVLTSSGCTSYGQRAPAVVVDGGVTVLDPDDLTLDSARVRVAANFERGDDLLFTDQNGITGSYDDTTGVLTLSGTASVADYETAIRSVREAALVLSRFVEDVYDAD